MKMELSQKDIRLLKIMFSLLIGVVMVRFLIVPAIGKHQELSYEKEEAELKQEEMEFCIDNIETSRASVEKTRADLTALSSSYYDLMGQDKIDELVTGLAYAHELFPSRLEIGQETGAGLAPYLYSEKGKAKEEAAEATAESAENAEMDTYLKSTQAGITLVGSQENALALLDDIEKNYPSVQVKSFDVSRASYMNTSMNLVEETQTSLVLTVYMRSDLDKNGESK